MIALALQNIAPDYLYRGSLTAENKEAFDALVDLGGTKPTWEAIQAELLIVEAKELQKDLEKAVQNVLDTKAQESGYDNILSACSYAGHMNPFQVEGQAFVEWRGSVWEYCYQELEKIQTGVRTVPTIEEFVVELPTYTG